MSEEIEKPSHYQRNGIDVIDFAKLQFDESELKGFHRVNALKYIVRYDRKGTPIQDLKKAKSFIDKLIEMEEQKTAVFPSADEAAESMRIFAASEKRREE